jgi:hypothetical protein
LDYLSSIIDGGGIIGVRLLLPIKMAAGGVCEGVDDDFVPPRVHDLLDEEAVCDAIFILFTDVRENLVLLILVKRLTVLPVQAEGPTLAKRFI